MRTEPTPAGLSAEIHLQALADGTDTGRTSPLHLQLSQEPEPFRTRNGATRLVFFPERGVGILPSSLGAEEGAEAFERTLSPFLPHMLALCAPESALRRANPLPVRAEPPDFQALALDLRCLVLVRLEELRRRNGAAPTPGRARFFVAFQDGRLGDECRVRMESGERPLPCDSTHMARCSRAFSIFSASGGKWTAGIASGLCILGIDVGGASGHEFLEAASRMVERGLGRPNLRRRRSGGRT